MQKPFSHQTNQTSYLCDAGDLLVASEVLS